MLNFKEYTLMSFKNLFQERFKNHFLKKAGKDIFKYQFGSGFLSSLSVGGNNSKAIEYFVGQIDTNDLYKDLYDSFLSLPDTPLKIRNYYVFAAYYMKLQGFPIGLPKINKDLNKNQNGFIALKEIFANELYEHLLILNKGKKLSLSAPTSIDQIKSRITKTFVPDGKSRIPISGIGSEELYISSTYFMKLTYGSSYVSENEAIKKLSKDLVLLYNGIETDVAYNAVIKTRTIPEKAVLYNDLALSFDKSIFNKENFIKNITGVTHSSQWIQNEAKNSAYRSTTKDGSYLTLLQKNGAYIEFYFKFDNVFENGSPGLTIFGKKNGKTNLKDLFKNERKSNLTPAEYTYYSFREMSAYCLFLKKIAREGDHQITTPDLLKDFVNFGIGARFVVATPALEDFIQNKLEPNTEYQNQYLASTPPKGLATEDDFKKASKSTDELLLRAEKYSSANNITSVWKNKSFVYNLVEQIKESDKEWETLKTFDSGFGKSTIGTNKYTPKTYNVTDINCVSLANYEISLSKQETKDLLNNLAASSYVDFEIDAAMVSKYFNQIIDGLFNQDIVKDYSLSKLNSLNAIGSFYIDNDTAYKVATQGTMLASENSKLKNEANKMDNIIDQNLITLIDSVEAF
jgi:hypothetical protein